MRNFKFRAWNTDYKTPAMEYFNLFDDRGYLSDKHIMQYTGLYDIDKKEICEDDIVQHSEGLNIVKYHNGGFWATYLCSIDNAYVLTNMTYLLSELENECQIIGNRWENPELLK